MLTRSPEKTAAQDAGKQRVSQGPHPVRFRWLREPLFHFILIGAVIFAVNAWRNRAANEGSPKRIVLTDEELDQMVFGLRAQGLPNPSASEFQSMIQAKIREEVLYREALAMGLDQDDTIVKRRMAQKMEFLAEDLSTLHEPTPDELKTWLKEHPKDFAYPPRVSFHHLYFASDKHRDQTRDAAAAALPGLANLAANAPEAEALGDPFMFESVYSDQTPDQVTRTFGPKFARSLFGQKAGAWTGPIESGYGWHLAFIDSLTPGRVPEFEEVEAEVKTQWEAKQRKEFKAEAYRVMREKYEVVLPKNKPGDSGGNGDGK